MNEKRKEIVDKIYGEVAMDLMGTLMSWIFYIMLIIIAAGCLCCISMCWAGL